MRPGRLPRSRARGAGAPPAGRERRGRVTVGRGAGVARVRRSQHVQRHAPYGGRMTKVEQETTIRWDCADHVAWLATTHAATARRWRRLGYSVRVLGTTRGGAPRSWEARVPVRCISFR